MRHHGKMTKEQRGSNPNQEVTAGWIIKGYPVGSGSLGKTFKRTIENGALKGGLKEDQLGVALSVALRSYNESHLESFASNSHLKSSLCTIWTSECPIGFLAGVCETEPVSQRNALQNILKVSTRIDL